MNYVHRLRHATNPINTQATERMSPLSTMRKGMHSGIPSCDMIMSIVDQSLGAINIANKLPTVHDSPPRPKTKLFNDMRREITCHETIHQSTTLCDSSGAVSIKPFGTQRDTHALGIWNALRSFGGNLSHVHLDVIGDTTLPIEPLANGDPEQPRSAQNLLLDSLENMEPHCGCFHELPPWYSITCDSHILTGYRVNYDALLSLKSIFQLHNETANIWTEFLPALLLAGLVIYFNFADGHFWASSDVHSPLTKSILFISVPLVLMRPIISGFAHTLSAMSQKASKIWWKLDFLSIIVATGAGSMIWIHCVFFCDTNLQILYGFAVFALSASTMMTAMTSQNSVIRDLSIGAFFIFTLIFIYFYELYLFFLSTSEMNIPNSMMMYWSISVGCILCAVVFRATQCPESIFVKRRFKRLMQKAFEEQFVMNKNDENGVEATGGDARKPHLKQQVSFERMLEDIQSFAGVRENKLAKIETMEHALSNDVNPDTLHVRKQELQKEIEKLENEIMNSIQNEITVEQCMETAYVELISNEQKQWFNYVFTSHNCWHIFLNLAVVFSVAAWKEYFDWRALEKNWC
eukprot:508874_1